MERAALGGCAGAGGISNESRPMLLSFVAGLVMSILVYGSMCYLAGRLIQRIAAGRAGLIFFLVAVALLWIPSIAVCYVIASIIPLEWGHAGEMIFTSSVIGGLLVFFIALLRFGEAITSDRTIESAAANKVFSFRCGACQFAIDGDTSKCPRCGFTFGSV